MSNTLRSCEDMAGSLPHSGREPDSARQAGQGQNLFTDALCQLKLVVRHSRAPSVLLLFGRFLKQQTGNEIVLLLDVYRLYSAVSLSCRLSGSHNAGMELWNATSF